MTARSYSCTTLTQNISESGNVNKHIRNDPIVRSASKKPWRSSVSAVEKGEQMDSVDGEGVKRRNSANRARENWRTGAKWCLVAVNGDNQFGSNQYRRCDPWWGHRTLLPSWNQWSGQEWFGVTRVPLCSVGDSGGRWNNCDESVLRRKTQLPLSWALWSDSLWSPSAHELNKGPNWHLIPWTVATCKLSGSLRANKHEVNFVKCKCWLDQLTKWIWIYQINNWKDSKNNSLQLVTRRWLVILSKVIDRYKRVKCNSFFYKWTGIKRKAKHSRLSGLGDWV